jgi:hypothetical protein
LNVHGYSHPGLAVDVYASIISMTAGLMVVKGLADMIRSSLLKRQASKGRSDHSQLSEPYIGRTLGTQ